MILSCAEELHICALLHTHPSIWSLWNDQVNPLQETIRHFVVHVRVCVSRSIPHKRTELCVYFSECFAVHATASVYIYCSL